MCSLTHAVWTEQVCLRLRFVPRYAERKLRWDRSNHCAPCCKLTGGGRWGQRPLWGSAASLQELRLIHPRGRPGARPEAPGWGARGADTQGPGGLPGAARPPTQGGCLRSGAPAPPPRGPRGVLHPCLPRRGPKEAFAQGSLLGKGLSVWGQAKCPTLGLVSSPTLSSSFLGFQKSP